MPDGLDVVVVGDVVSVVVVIGDVVAGDVVSDVVVAGDVVAGDVVSDVVVVGDVVVGDVLVLSCAYDAICINPTRAKSNFSFLLTIGKFLNV